MNSYAMKESATSSRRILQNRRVKSIPLRYSSMAPPARNGPGVSFFALSTPRKFRTQHLLNEEGEIG